VAERAARLDPSDAGPLRVPAPSGPLQPVELATASVLAGVTVILVLAGWLIPHASGLIGLAVVPMAVVAYRHRPRAVVASTVAAVTVAFLVAGTGPVPTVGLCAAVGGIAGQARRRKWRWPAVLGAAFVCGPAFGAVADLALVAFGPLRRLTIRNLRDTWDGYARLVGSLRGLRAYVHPVTQVVQQSLQLWWAVIPAAIALVAVVGTWTTWYYIPGLLRRLDRIPVEDRLAPPAGAVTGTGSPDSGGAGITPGPVPVTLEDVSVRYPGAPLEALDGVSLSVSPRERTVVLGPNGSGKSTLARVLAGRAPSSGRVIRPGPVGLGRPGGTAFVSQQPESQVLGVRVADDLVWGLPGRWPVDVDGLLATVGLSGLATRETSTLSGGQLQRLALASALARRPSLLIADEVTAMVDSSGREEIVSLLARLPAGHGVSVVQVTHRLEEVAGADRVRCLDSGRLVVDPRSRPAGPAGASTATATAPVGPGGDVDLGPGGAVGRRSRRVGDELLVADRVSHTYADRTPWSQTALRGVSVSVRAGEGLLVVGDNGSGKTTLAWVLAGLLRPTEGECRLRGAPVHRHVGSVALAFQHARLQVQAATVGADVEAAGGVDRRAGEEALARLGLDPELLWDRPVDTLSGGQLRRVALAGLLASDPEVLVADEPLAGLDDESREALLAALVDLRNRRGLTLVVISHDAEAGVVCDRTVRLERGVVVGEGPLPADPAGTPGPPSSRDTPPLPAQPLPAQPVTAAEEIGLPGVPR